MMEEQRQADLHAFVDDCLEPDRRAAFEARMAANPALARRAARWRAQNNAIRMAFGGETASASSFDFARRASGKSAPQARPPLPEARPIRGDPGGRAGGGAEAARIPDRPGPPKAARSWPVRALIALTLSLGLVSVSATGPPTPPGGLTEAGVAAFAAFGIAGGEPVEFATSDPRLAEGWLDGRLARPVRLPATPPGLNLVGARITPALRAAAAFLVYEAGRNRVGLLVQRLDAPSPAAPKVAAAGAWRVAVWTDAEEGFALVGDLGEPSFSGVATALYQAPYEIDQPDPDRGS